MENSKWKIKQQDQSNTKHKRLFKVSQTTNTHKENRNRKERNPSNKLNRDAEKQKSISI